MTEIERIADQFARAYDGKAWHGTPLRRLLRDVTWRQAAARPVAGTHSIWELVLHIGTWRDVVCRRIAGEVVPEELPAAEDWRSMPEPTEAAWKDAMAALDRSQERALAAMRTLIDERLEERAPGVPYTLLRHASRPRAARPVSRGTDCLAQEGDGVGRTRLQVQASANIMQRDMRLVSRSSRETRLATLCLSLVITAGSRLQGQSLAGHQQLARDVYKQLIEIDTTRSTAAAVEAVAARFKTAGFPAADIFVGGPSPAKQNIVVRYRGNGRGKAILLLGHLDVVDARREDWSVDPFTLTEKDGYFYGRGTVDDKSQVAVWIANLIRYKQENWIPSRDLILALTADEEGGDANGVEWLVKTHRPLIDAAFCLNEDAKGRFKGDTYLFLEVQASEKVYQSFRLEVTNQGGHSSRPRKDNAIYQLAAGLTRLSAHAFPVKLSEITRTFFERSSALESGQLAKDLHAVTGTPPDPGAIERLAAIPLYNAMMRTTCVATRLEGGHADNALPQTARATVNCRILPSESPDDVGRTLVEVLSDSGITVTPIEQAAATPDSPLTPEVFGTIERITRELWPGVPVIPTMAVGATDGVFLRPVGIPTYGVMGLFVDINEDRNHGRDERVGVKQFYECQEFLYRLVKRLGST